MNKKFLNNCLAATLLGLASVSVQASSIWLEPAGTSIINQGDPIAFNVFADASDITNIVDNPPFPPVTETGFLAGGFDVFYDIAVLTYTGFDFNFASGTEPAFTRVGDDCSIDLSPTGCTEPGEINGLGFGNFAGLAGTTTLLGVLNFEGTNVGSSLITMADSDSVTGPWFGVDSLLATVDYTGANVDVVPAIPVPAAAWLMLSGLGLLGGIARRKANA